MIDLDKVIENLREVYDPEMDSINVYDLGLIYDISITNDTTVTIKHTLTSAACPFADYIIAMIKGAATNETGATECIIDLTFDPPFTMEMVPEDIRAMMGWI